MGDNPFKPGDIVRADDISDCDVLTQGKHYLVNSVTPEYIRIVTNNGKEGGMFYDRFSLVARVEKAGPQPEVDHKRPSYYESLPISPITYIRANGLNFNRGNIVKYATRAGNKPGEDDIKELEKIIRYAQAEINAIKIERSGDPDWSEGI